MIRPLYKSVEPFMEVKRGFGYQGVIQYDDQEDKIQCHICGKWFRYSGMHIAKKHGMLSDDYKMKYGLSLGTPLCGERESARHSIIAKAQYTGEKRRKMIASCKNLYKRRRKQRVVGGLNMQVKNARGLCDLQMRSRYEVVKRIVKREPSSSDLEKYDRKLYQVISDRGNLNKFRQSIGVSTKTASDWRTLPDLDYVVALRKKAKEKKRCPRPSDFQLAGTFPSRATFYKHFGSWNSALRTAGLK